MYPKAQYTGVGIADPERDEEIRQEFQAQVKDDTIRKDRQIIVLIDTLPSGFNLSDGVVGVDDGWDHEVLGKFSISNFDTHLRFSNYKDGWRKGLCYPQVPLQWLTLTLWTLVPTDYPCHPLISAKKTSVIQDVRALVHAAGGDAAIISYRGQGDDRAVGAGGFIIRLDRKAVDENGDLETTPIPKDDLKSNLASLDSTEATL
ncbi:MAG: med21 domain-containing protein [Polyangiaceae bacterium]|nr:med21 domain-containing protein [Polyangiaceae bacterium]